MKQLLKIGLVSALAVLGACGGGGGGGGGDGGGSSGTFTAVTAMSGPRMRAASVRLPDGRALVVGGLASSATSSALNTAEIYDPVSRQWSATGSMHIPRWGDHNDFLVSLADGRALAVSASSNSSTSAEIYDPATGTWTDTTPPPSGVFLPTLTLLDNGRVLLIPGGTTDALLYDPATAQWTTAPGFDGRTNFATALMEDGRVLVSGGCLQCNAQILATALIFDPATLAWTPTGTMLNARHDHFSVLLDDGRVLVSHGLIQSLSNAGSSEVYDPASGTWAETGDVIKEGPYTNGATATQLSNGDVLVAGGSDGRSSPILDIPPQGTLNQTNAEVFDLHSLSWQRASKAGTGLVQPRYYHTAVRLGDGSVLIAGGTVDYSSTTPLSAAEIFH